MKTYIEQKARLMTVSELITVAGGKRQDVGLGLFEEAVNFEAFLNTLTDSKRKVIEAAVELYKRSIASKGTQILDSKDIYEVMKEKIGDLNHEEFWLITMNQAARIISRRRLSAGGIDQTTVDVRQVMKYALQDNATQIAISHNHPSGNLTPSNEDTSITRKIKNASELMNIRLIDHVIVAKDRFYSFHDHGLI